MQFSEIQVERELLTLQYVLLYGGIAVAVAALIIFFTVTGRRITTAAATAMAAGILLMAGSAVAGQVGQTRSLEAADNKFHAALLETYGLTTDAKLSSLMSGSDANGEAPAFVNDGDKLMMVTFRFTTDTIEIDDVDGKPLEASR